MRNKIILMLVLGLTASLTNAQKIKEKDVPVVVKTAFQKQYPAAKKVKWEKEDGNYEVEFDLYEIDNSVLYNEKGEMLEMEVEIQQDQLPAGVIDYMKANYPGMKVKEAAMITDAKGIVTYEAEIKGKDVTFDSKGKFIKEAND